MTAIAFPDASARIREAINAGVLKAGSWGGTDGNDTVCMMSAIVSGAQSSGDCITAGWPKWLTDLNVYLFDATVGADDEDKARQHFALRVAELVAAPRDMDRARDLFLIRRLDDGEYSALKTLRSLDGDWAQQIEAVTVVAGLLRRRTAGECVAKAMKAAYAAAYAAYAAAAADAARAAADAAARADLILSLMES